MYGFDNSAFWLGVGLEEISSCCQERFPQRRVKTVCICSYKDKCLGCSQGLCWCNSDCEHSLDAHTARGGCKLCLCTSEDMKVGGHILLYFIISDCKMSSLRWPTLYSKRLAFFLVWLFLLLWVNSLIELLLDGTQGIISKIFESFLSLD